jgi:hypothetical protein
MVPAQGLDDETKTLAAANKDCRVIGFRLAGLTRSNWGAMDARGLGRPLLGVDEFTLAAPACRH